MRKISANYIFLPGFPLVKNGYVVFREGKEPEVRDTGGEIMEFAGLEFYGGMIVPDYVCGETERFVPDSPFLPVLDEIYREYGKDYLRPALVEKADLRNLIWGKNSRVRYLF